jgi:hypothetical protein
VFKVWEILQVNLTIFHILNYAKAYLQNKYVAGVALWWVVTSRVLFRTATSGDCGTWSVMSRSLRDI